jgi:hypothetical protein
MTEIIILCPHCSNYIIIAHINCAIFRHGADKISFTQIHPHSSKQICDKLKQEDSIYGCGKPFKIIIKEGKYVAEICDYI